MKKLYAFFCMAFALSASAQISFLKTDYGVAGDKVLYEVDTPAASSMSAIANITGSAVSWNFSSGLVVVRNDSVRYVLPSTVPNPPVSANLLVLSTNNSQQFENVDTGFVKLISDLPQYNINGLILKVFKFPFTYGSVLIDSVIYTKAGPPGDFNFTSAQVFGADSLKFDIRDYITTTGTGYGTLTLPDTGCAALQVNTTRNTYTTMSAHGSPLGAGWVVVNPYFSVPVYQKSVNVDWLAKNSKSFIARAVMDTSGTVVQSFYWKKKTLVPAITLVTPNNGQRGQTLNITISGSNTHFTQVSGLSSVVFSKGSVTLTVNSINKVDDSTIIASLTIKQTDSLGYYDVRITDPADSTLALNSSFQVNPSVVLPSLINVNPGFGSRGQTLNVTISGSHTHFTQVAGVSGVSFTKGPGTLTVNSINKVNDSTIVASLTLKQTDSLGYYDVRITDPADSTLALNSSFQVKASVVLPKLNSITPSSGSRKLTMNVSISGSATHFTQGPDSLTFYYGGSPSSHIKVNSITIANDSSLSSSITIDSVAGTGTYDINVKNPVDGILSLTGAFSIFITGINEMQNSLSSVFIYPNPANNILQLSFTSQSSPVSIQLFDIAGRNVKSLNTSNNHVEIDISDLNNGIYFCTITGKDFTASRKIMINK